MIVYLGRAETGSASRYLQQLCKHWGHKFEVAFDPAHGRIDFDPDTACILDAHSDRLEMQLEGADRARVERMTGVVTDHLKRFAFREELSVEWREDAGA